MTELQKILKSFKKIFIQIGIFSFFINILILAAPIYMLAVYDIVMPAKSIDTLIVITSIIIILFVAMGILEYVRNKIMLIISNELDKKLNEKIYNSTFEMVLKYPSKTSAEPLNDLNSIKNFLSGTGLIALFDAPWIIIYISIMFAFSYIYGLYAIGAIIIILAITLLNNYLTKDLFKQAISKHREANEYISNQLKNAEVVEAMGMRKNLFNIWNQKYLEFLNIQEKASYKSSLYSNLGKTFKIMSSSLMYGVGAILAIYGEISPGMIIAGAVLLSRSLTPMSQLIGSWKNLITAKEAYQRLNKLLQEYPIKENKLKLPEIKGNISIKNLTSTPPLSKKIILKNINLSINSGEIVAIIGPSGAGKSSLLRLLLGIWKPISGEIRIDNAEIFQYNKEELGKNIGYLPQDIELFEGTIAQNISRFSKTEDKNIIQAAMLAGVHEMILQMDDGYNTYISSGGKSLSAGQRQRIALARAIFNNPKIIILDEPNSNLDEFGEMALIKALLELKKQKSTIIFITHKQSLLKIADKIAFLQNGELKLFGAAQEIFAKLQNKR